MVVSGDSPNYRLNLVRMDQLAIDQIQALIFLRLKFRIVVRSDGDYQAATGAGFSAVV